MAQNDINIKVQVDTSQAEKSTINYRQRVRELKDEMTSLQLAGKENTAEYAALANELGKITDAMSDTSAQARILSDDFFKQRAAMEGLSVGVNIFSGLTQAAALCGAENEDLQEVLVKLQAAQNLANTAMNIAKALNKDTALMTALRMDVTKELNSTLTTNTVATEGATVATQSLNKAEVTATTTSKGLSLSIKSIGAAIKSIPIVGWITAAVTALMVLKSKLDTVREEQKKAYEETQKRYTESQDKINKSVADTVVKFDKLRYEYEKLGDTVEEKNKFIKEHQGAFNELGLSIRSVEDAEDAFVKNKTKFIDALMAKAQAAAAFDTATEKFVKIFENKRIIEENKKLAESLEAVWKSQGVSQSEIEKSLKSYTDANDNLQSEIDATMSEIESLYELMGDDEPIKNTGNTIKEVTALVEDFDAEMEQAMKGIDWRTEKEKSDEFWNSLFINMDEYQQKGEEIDRESLEYAEKTSNDLDDELAKIKRNKEERLRALQATADFAAGVSDVMNALMEDELSKVEGNQRKEQQIRKKYAQRQFALEINRIALDTASAIMGTWAGYSEMGPFGIAAAAIQTAVIAALGVTQTIKAKTAMSNALAGKAARGAFVTGKSHAQGGELWELEGGEAVLNKRAMAIPAFRNLASAMNEATGGVSFSSKTMQGSSPVLAASVSDEAIAKIVAGVTAIPVVVTENDITTAQRNVSVIEQRSRF